MNINNTKLEILSKAKANEVDNPLSKPTLGATLFTVVQIISFLGWFYWAYSKYIQWYQYHYDPTRIDIESVGDNIKSIPKLPETSIVKIGIPLFLISIAIEWLICLIIGEKENYRAADTIASLSNGIVQQMIEMWTTILGEWFGLAMITAIPYRWIYENYGLTRSLEGNWQGFVFMFFARDFGYYWFHRAAHRCAFMWAVHGVHHLPNAFSYHVNLCQGGIQRLTSALFYAPLALFCPPELYTIIFPMEKIYGFFTHTSLVAKASVPIFGYFFVTPSSHRVHHAGAPSKYIDKNYGEMLSIWDRMFGTHQEEDDPIVFGHVHPFDSWNPLNAQLSVWSKIIEKTKTCKKWSDKILCFLMPPGWNPIDNSEYPLEDTHPYSADKYDSQLPTFLTGYIVLWFLPTLTLAVYTMLNYQIFSTIFLLVLFSFVMFSLISFGTCTDRSPNSVIYEILRLLVIPVIIYNLPFTITYSIRNEISMSFILIVSYLISTVSILIILSHSYLFISESKPQRYKRVWIKEAGRQFTLNLQKELNQKNFVSSKSTINKNKIQ
ncbi:hypothetical protein DLAC_01368 [Tieghemostelium lacteum]|uniref:Fatty acid hydroxylase domain-containing protein n=1 Tax=Tieghemostelium lacteum TaxID=361077 RepID=A0A152A8J6_TIELA|nr:hypothetical protein DLAC_01368 [Tieghemostelium lacteum]|eukprot:KYR02524.1 hypothetical protein DLAC_01368 [Tieghemostelium lacteum]